MFKLERNALGRLFHRSDDGSERLGAVGVFGRHVHDRAVMRRAPDDLSGSCESLVVFIGAIGKKGRAGESGTVLTIRAFTWMCDVKTGDHRDAVLSRYRDDLLHQRTDLSVINIFFVHGVTSG